MINVTRFPVVIFASPRTGSTSLTHHIQRLYPGNSCFCEPDLRELDHFLQYSSSYTNYIVKIMAKNIHKYPNDLICSPDNFFIKIYRKSIVDQIASNYIARERNMWYYLSNSGVLDLPIPIDPLKIKENIAIINGYNEALNRVDIKFDLEIAYEDLPPLSGNDHIITPKPINYNDLKTTISAYLQFYKLPT